MSTENVKKLELGIKKAAFGEGMSENASNEELQILVNEGMDLVEKAISSGEMDVLERAFDYFLEESPDNGLGNGVCESLESEIFQYFSWDQIFNVLKLKLSKLIELNIDRAIGFACACDIKEVEELMRTLPLAEANVFIAKLKDSCREDLANQITDLQEEMKSW